jgi:hypothetical protein
MNLDFLNLTPEELNIILVGAVTIATALEQVAACEACSRNAEIPFDTILDQMTGSDPSVTDYVLEHAGKCPKCFRQVNEKTLVELL